MSVMRPTAIRTAISAFSAIIILATADAALAQLAHHPFAIGANEGAIGHTNGLGAWILGQESRFYLALTSAVRAARTGGGLAILIGLSFAYGVFHAAGPGHGKAVITSYMVSNERALRRGVAIALAAALLQGLVATALVGIAAFLFHATAARMTAAAQALELTSYLGIVALGMALVWRKGRALAMLLRAPAPALLVAAGPPGFGSLRLPAGAVSASRFRADDCTRHEPGCDCGVAHIPEPGRLAGARLDMRTALLAVVTAGARPCSGAILVLVFSLPQGLFAAGVAATFAMALGTAITTGALAIAAVFAKDVALRLAGGHRAAVTGKLIELGAAAIVLVFGLALLGAAFAGAITSA